MQVRIQARRDLEAGRQQWVQERDVLVSQYAAAALKVGPAEAPSAQRVSEGAS